MAGIDVNSPGLFAGLDADIDGFGLTDDTLAVDNNHYADGGLPDDGGLGTAGPVTLTTPPSDETSVTNAGTGTSGTSTSLSPSAAAAASHTPHQPNFFPSVTAPQWTFQDNPPYDSPVSESPFGTVPPQQQSWDLPVHLNLNQPQPQQQQSLNHQPGASPVTEHPTLGPTTVSANGPPVPASAPNPPVTRPESQRSAQKILNPAQRERLKTIAMPPHLQYRSPKSTDSPESASSRQGKGAGSSPEDEPKTNSKKRKLSADVDDDDEDEEFESQHPVRKTAHNEIEKRYRTNLNDKIAALRDSVPSLRIMCKSARGEDTTEDREELHGLTPAHKLNKATVLSKATEYIRHLEKRNNRLIEENNSMQARIAAFEKLFMAGGLALPSPLQQSPTPMQYAQDAAFMNPGMSTTRAPDPQGMIPIPDDMKRILSAQQMNAGRPYPVPQHFGQTPTLLRQQQIQQQQQQQQQQQAQSSSWNPYLGRLMVGTLAGLMLVEAVVENEQSNEKPEGRGLFGVPVQLLAAFVRSAHFSIGGYHLSVISMFAKLRFLSLIGLFLWLAYPSFCDTTVSRPPQKTKQVISTVRPAPSLASPIHVRRQAWLTAIQTVWVPRHNFILEAAALMLKTLKYTLRNAIGQQGYLALAGLSEEQEAARVKAWSIALDAQLAGGDVEINKSRLTLTLIASGTLPDTPLRLMLKALHIRVLLWRLNGAAWAANIIAAKLARAKWNEARHLNRILHSLAEKETIHEEALPEHLALLLEQDCDEVLNNDIIQRAHNLAWNLPTTHNVIAEIDGMDAVVEDTAVQSPMDAVAAWYSCLMIHRVLVNSLSKPKDDPTVAITPRSAADDITLAARIAPVGSYAQVRALVARAVLVNDGKNGAADLQVLGPSAKLEDHGQFSRVVSALSDSSIPSIAPDPDAQMALRCAIGIAQLRKSAEPPIEVYTVIDSILPHGGAGVEGMSLLGYTAAFHLMETLCRHPVGRDTCSRTMERVAGALRIWVGSEACCGSEKLGVGEELRTRMVSRCIAVTKSVVGMGMGGVDRDQGYVSMEDEEEESDSEEGEDGYGGC